MTTYELFVIIDDQTVYRDICVYPEGEGRWCVLDWMNTYMDALFPQAATNAANGDSEVVVAFREAGKPDTRVEYKMKAKISIIWEIEE